MKRQLLRLTVAGTAALLCTAQVSRASPVTAAAPAAAAAAPAPQRLNHGRFKDFPVYLPAGTARSVALLLSDARGWDAAADGYARELVGAGALVIGIDTRQFSAALDADSAGCVFPDGDLENLSHFVQAYLHLPTYLTPILVGAGSGGGALAYAVLAQSPADTFGGAVSLGFCPTLPGIKPPCKGTALKLRPGVHGGRPGLLPAASLGDPWIVLQPDIGAACKSDVARRFVAQVHGGEFATVTGDAGASLRTAFARLTATGPAMRLAPPPAELGDLPVVVVPATAGAPGSNSIAILLSGDGGWAGLDQSVAGALAAAGMPVIGLDSLRYFWTARTPEGLAGDLDRMIRYYLARLGKQRALLIGYSQGADVLPFAVNRLPAATRASVGLVAIMGMSQHALFEFHVSSWISDDDSGPATLPEVRRIAGTPVMCIYGADESDSLCPQLDPARVRLVEMPGGHHFNGDYAGLARQILAAAH